MADMLAPAPFSEWHRRIANYRVVHYDGVRPPLSRAICLIAIALALVMADIPWWGWFLLVPAVVQFILDVSLHNYALPDAGDPRSVLSRWIVEAARENRHTMALNAGGLAAVLACPLNLVAVCFVASAETAGWVKIAGLAAGVLYLNSCLSQGFLDPPYYSETSTMPPAMHWLRPLASLIALVGVLAVVAVSICVNRWESDIAPVAMLTAGLTLLAGATVRDHDRVVAAAAHVGREAVLAGRRELGRVVHDDLNDAKVAAERASVLPGVDVRDRTELQALSAFLTHFSTRVELTAGLRIDLRNLVEQIASPYGLGPSSIRCDIRWDTAAMRSEDHQIAVRMATALVLNAVQQLAEERHSDIPKAIVLECFTSGSGHRLRYHVAVSEQLPLIPVDEWCLRGDTLAALRDWLHDDYNGDLVQESHGADGKRIVASWHDRYQGERA
ncbi:hypothetical protein [Mycobacterium sp. M26]|uniref:hypothetical protein n=1 Tax=Mycobacterium sp. M26 TaxID=1762962 RepID=UPI0012E3A372|nr:hypothetical protein [Mycobacterium sp. M26]